MMAAARPMLLWSTVAADSDLRPICIVSHWPSVTTARGQVYWFQRRQERDHGERGDDRAGHRDGDPPEEAGVAEAVELGGVAQVARDAEEALADEEGAERGGEERRGQARDRS